MRFGIDTSHWNHTTSDPIDWRVVRETGIDWAAIKLTEGTSFIDPWAARDVAAAKAAGMETLAYHFARPTKSDAARQAAFFVAQIDRVGGVHGTVLDVEDGRQMGWAALAAWVRSFVEIVGADLVYWNLDYKRNIEPHYAPAPGSEWVAAPSSRSTPPGAAVWQKAQGRVSGIDGLVDLNVVGYKRPDIDGSPASPPVAPAARPPVSRPTLRHGATGEPVAALQRRLGALGYRLAIDGVFGDRTRTAVADFQRGHGLRVDGVVGPKTWGALNP